MSETRGACPVCETPDPEEVRIDDGPMSGGAMIVCQDCGLEIIAPASTAAVLWDALAFFSAAGGIPNLATARDASGRDAPGRSDR